jgi:hypothetical protein
MFQKLSLVGRTWNPAAARLVSTDERDFAALAAGPRFKPPQHFLIEE